MNYPKEQFHYDNPISDNDEHDHAAESLAAKIVTLGGLVSTLGGLISTVASCFIVEELEKEHAPKKRKNKDERIQDLEYQAHLIMKEIEELKRQGYK